MAIKPRGNRRNAELESINYELGAGSFTSAAANPPTLSKGLTPDEQTLRIKAAWERSPQGLPAQHLDLTRLSDEEIALWQELSEQANFGTTPSEKLQATSELIARGWHEPSGDTTIGGPSAEKPYNPAFRTKPTTVIYPQKPSEAEKDAARGRGARKMHMGRVAAIMGAAQTDIVESGEPRAVMTFANVSGDGVIGVFSDGTFVDADGVKTSIPDDFAGVSVEEPQTSDDGLHLISWPDDIADELEESSAESDVAFKGISPTAYMM